MSAPVPPVAAVQDDVHEAFLAWAMESNNIMQGDAFAAGAKWQARAAQSAPGAGAVPDGWHDALTLAMHHINKDDGDTAKTIIEQVRAEMLAAPIAAQEPVAWARPGALGLDMTDDALQAGYWKKKDSPVRPLIYADTAPPAPQPGIESHGEAAVRDTLMRAGETPADAAAMAREAWNKQMGSELPPLPDEIKYKNDLTLDDVRTYGEIVADSLAASRQAPQYPLPDDLYGSKDWKSGSYKERVEWLHTMYEACKADRDELVEQAQQGVAVDPVMRERAHRKGLAIGDAPCGVGHAAPVPAPDARDGVLEEAAEACGVIAASDIGYEGTKAALDCVVSIRAMKSQAAQGGQAAPADAVKVVPSETVDGDLAGFNEWLGELPENPTPQFNAMAYWMQEAWIASRAAARKSKPLSNEQIDELTEPLMRASGTSLRYFTMQKSKDDMRAAMRIVIEQAHAIWAAQDQPGKDAP